MSIFPGQNSHPGLLLGLAVLWVGQIGSGAVGWGVGRGDLSLCGMARFICWLIWCQAVRRASTGWTWMLLAM